MKPNPPELSRGLLVIRRSTVVGRMNYHYFVPRFLAHFFFVTIYLRQHLIECKEARL